MTWGELQRHQFNQLEMSYGVHSHDHHPLEMTVEVVDEKLMGDLCVKKDLEISLSRW